MLARKIARAILRRFGIQNFYAARFLPGENLDGHLADLKLVADFRPTDRILDVGCAEGLISLFAAERARHVLAIDPAASRIVAAKATAHRRAIENVEFRVGSSADAALEPHDIVLFLGVLGKRNKAGLGELERMIALAGRQIYIRVGIDGRKAAAGIGIEHIFAALNDQGFDAVCLGRHELRRSLIVGNRRGTDARLRKLPPFVVFPTKAMPTHPCVTGVEIGNYSEFNL